MLKNPDDIFEHCKFTQLPLLTGIWTSKNAPLSAKGGNVWIFSVSGRQVMACGAGISKGNIKYKSVSEKEVTLNDVVILR